MHGSRCQKWSSCNIGHLGNIRPVLHTHLHFTKARVARIGSIELWVISNNISLHAHGGDLRSLLLLL